MSDLTTAAFEEAYSEWESRKQTRTRQQTRAPAQAPAAPSSPFEEAYSEWERRQGGPQPAQAPAPAPAQAALRPEESFRLPTAARGITALDTTFRRGTSTEEPVGTTAEFTDPEGLTIDQSAIKAIAEAESVLAPEIRAAELELSKGSGFIGTPGPDMKDILARKAPTPDALKKWVERAKETAALGRDDVSVRLDAMSDEEWGTAALQHLRNIAIENEIRDNPKFAAVRESRAANKKYDRLKALGPIDAKEYLGRITDRSGGLPPGLGVAKNLPIPSISIPLKFLGGARIRRNLDLVKAFVNRKDDPETGSFVPIDQYRRAEEELARYLDALNEVQVRGTTLGADVVGTLIKMPSFMAEFMAGAGIAKGAGALTAAKTAGILSKFGPRLGGAMLRATVWAARGAARAVTVGLGDVSERQALYQSGGDSPWKAATKAFAEMTIEFMSEEAGRTMMRGISSGFSKLSTRSASFRSFAKTISKWAKNAGIKGGGGILEAAGTGFDGVPEEMLEERLGEVMRFILSQAPGMEDLSDSPFPTGRQLLTEAIAFAVPGAISAGAAIAAGLPPVAPADIPDTDILPEVAPATAAEQRPSGMWSELALSHLESGVTQEQAAENAVRIADESGDQAGKDYLNAYDAAGGTETAPLSPEEATALIDKQRAEQAPAAEPTTEAAPEATPAQVSEPTPAPVEAVEPAQATEAVQADESIATEKATPLPVAREAASGAAEAAVKPMHERTTKDLSALSDAQLAEEIKTRPLSHVSLGGVSGTGAGSTEFAGTYISTERGNRLFEGGGQLFDAEVRIKNPKIFRDATSYTTFRLQFLPEGQTVDDMFEEGPDGELRLIDDEKAGREATAHLRAQGFDSVYLPESNTSEGILVVFDRSDVTLTKRADVSKRIAEAAPQAEPARVSEPTQAPQEAAEPAGATEAAQADESIGPEKATPPVEAEGGKTAERTGFLNEEDQKTVDRLKSEIGDIFKTRVTTGLDADVAIKLVHVGALYVKQGATAFTQWSKRMVQGFGEGVKPHLEAIWARVSDVSKRIAETSRGPDHSIQDGKEKGIGGPLPASEVKAIVDQSAQAETKKPAEAAPEPSKEADVTGLRESVVVEERKKLGLTPEEKDATRSLPEVRELALARLNESSTAAQDLINELDEAPRALVDVEVAMLSIEKVRRHNARAAAEATVAQLAESGTDAEKADARRKLDVAARNLEELFDVAARGRGKSITETARGLSALRIMLNDQYELVEMEQAVRDKQGGSEVTDRQRTEIALIKSQHDAAKKRLDTRIEELTQELLGKTDELGVALANEKFAKSVADLNTAPGKESPFRAKMLSLADRLEAEVLASMRKRASQLNVGVDPTMLVDMGKLGAAYLIRGGPSFAQWSAKMHKMFRNATKSDISEAYDLAVKRANDERKKVATKPGAKGKGVTSQVTEIKELFREQVESGVTTLEGAVGNVHEILTKSGQEITPEQVRDSFSDYGKSRPMNTTEAKAILADLRRQAQLIASIERVERKLAPLKTGPQRGQQSDRVRELTRKLNRMMREAGINTRSEEGQLASALQSKKTRLENAIADTKKAIATGVRFEKGANTPIQDNTEIKQLQSSLDELKKEHDQLFPKEPISDEERVARAIKAAERNLKRMNKQTERARRGKFDKNVPSALPASERLDAVRAERDAAKAELETLRELAFPGQRALLAKKRRTLVAIKKTKQRIRDKDFTKKTQKQVDISSDPEAMAAQAEYEQVKNEFKALKEDARRSARTTTEIVKEFGLAIMDAQRNIRASFDVSAPGRQLWQAFLTNPKLTLWATAESFKAWSRRGSAKLAEELRESPDYGTLVNSGLALSPDDGTGNFNQVEDLWRLNLVGWIPGIKLSNRLFASALNTVRAELFRELLRNSADPSDVSIDKIRDIANGVNILTGRGELAHAEAWSRVGWAPRFVKSAFDILTVKPLRTGSRASRKQFLKQYGRAIASMTAIYMVAGLFRGPDDEDPVEWDPRSSDFGAIKITKNFSFNPIGHVRPLLVFLSRVITGVTKTRSGKRKIREHGTIFADDADAKKFGSDTGRVVWRFLQSKAHPTLGTGLSVLSGKTWSGEDITVGGIAKDMTLPLAPTEAYMAAMIDDPDAAVMISIMTMFGLDVRPDYESPEYIRFESKDEAAYEETVGKLLIQATDPGATDAEIARGAKASRDMTPQERALIMRSQYHGSSGSAAFRKRSRRLKRINTLEARPTRKKSKKAARNARARARALEQALKARQK